MWHGGTSPDSGREDEMTATSWGAPGLTSIGRVVVEGAGVLTFSFVDMLGVLVLDTF